MLKIKKPRVSVDRSGDFLSNLITLENFESGDTWNIYYFDDKVGEMISLASGISASTYNHSGLNAEKNYTYLVSLNNFPEEASLTIVSDNPEADPPYIEFTANSGVTVQLTSYNKIFPWTGNEVSILTYAIDGLRIEADLSNPIIKFGKNQIL